MGLVYEAEHVTIEKRVALKVLRDDFSSRPEVVERFKQEAKSATRIGNEHIVDISDFGTTPSGASYFVMELLEGEDLANVLERDGQVPLERAADILLQCCKALGAAHAKGIVHRDMKPENIFLTVRDDRRDFVKIVDFGIAKMSDVETAGAPGRKLTKTGMIFGTPEYMSPEQAAGKKTLDHRVDIYALAVIFFEMITGRVPFVGDTFMGILTQHMFEDPPRLHDVNPHVEVPDAVAAFIYRGLAKDPDERFRSCEEMAAALEHALAGRTKGLATFPGYGASVPATRRSPRTVAADTPDDLPTPPARRSRAGLVLGAVVVVASALAGGGAVWYFGSQGAAHDRDRASVVPAERPPEPRHADRAAPVFDSTAERTRSSPEPASLESAEEDTLALPEPAPEPAVDAGPAMVTVSVSTSPDGARVFVVGRGGVCSETPCSFETPAGQPVTVRARRGRAEADSVITPAANTVMQLELRSPRAPAARHGGSSRQGGESTGSMTGDLKIPDIFRRP
jgi:serine/threonine-protein kinase